MLLTTDAYPQERRVRARLGLALVLCGLLLVGAPQVRPQPHPAPAGPGAHVLAGLPLAFEPNAGQSAAAARYLAHAPGGTLFFTASGVVLALNAATEQPGGGPAGAQSRPAPHRAAAPPASVVRVEFLDANSSPAIAGEAARPGTVNYIKGRDRTRWRTALPTYGSLRYAGLYAGIDLQYGGAGGQLKSTYTVAPGADPAVIQWRYRDVQAATVDGAGDLQLTVGGATGSLRATLTDGAPVAWQQRDGQRIAVAVRYVAQGDGSFGFALGPYDRALPLTIDPTLTYSTYLGGFYSESAAAIAVDGAGNMYVTGSTNSPDFPTTPGAYQPVAGGQSDAFIAKISPDGSTLIYSTFLGGGGEIDGGDFGVAIAVDAAGNAIIGGQTDAADFPTTPGAYQTTYAGSTDLFVSKLDAAGSALIFSTYIGDDGVDEAGGFATDPAGNTYFTGSWYPGVASYASVGELNAAGSQLVFFQSLGGQVPGPGDQNANSAGAGVALDPAGNIYVTGYTRAADFPVSAGAYRTSIEAFEDGFVTKLSATTHALVYSTYLPGGVSDYPAAIAVDQAGSAYLTGNTSSSDFPITPGAFQPTYGDSRMSFATKLNPAGAALLYSTFLGGPAFMFATEDYGLDIAVNGAGAAYVVGYTSSPDFPVVNALQSALHGPADAFVTKLNPTGTGAGYSTYLGGSGGEVASGLALDDLGNAYVVGGTGSLDFPTVAPLQATNHGAGDAFVLRIADALFTPTPTRTGTPPTATPTRTPACGVIQPWRTEVPQPIARAESAAAVLDGQLYVIRGVANSPTPVPYTARFDPGAQAWATVAPLPNLLADTQAAAVAGRIYALGNSYEQSQSFMQIYDPATDTWSRGATLPEELLSGALAAYNGKVYLFGGQVPNQYPSPHVYEYDPATDTFTARAAMPSGQAEIGAAVVGNRIYVVGGWQYIHYAYDPAADTWTTIAAPPTPSFAVPGVFAFNGELWVVAGYDNATRRGYPPDQEVQIYSPLNNTWRFGPAFHTPRYYSTAGGVLGNRIYVVGGVDLNSNSYPYVYLDSMESLTVAACGTPAPPTDTPAPAPPSTTPTQPPSTAVPPPPSTTPTQPPGTPAPPPPSATPVPPSATARPPLGTATASPAAGTATATPARPTPTQPPCASTFSDVPPAAYFYTPVQYLACQGVISGYADGTFRPYNNTTRAQMVKIVVLGFGRPPATPPAGGATFVDVPAAFPFWGVIETAAGAGIVSGYSCGGPGEPCDNGQRPYFRPYADVTRGQLSKIVVGAAGWAVQPPRNATFADVLPGTAFYGFVEAAVQHGIVSGYSCGGPGEPCDSGQRPYFRPANPATRGQIAKIVYGTLTGGGFPAPAQR